jgi:DNA adenine methylase
LAELSIPTRPVLRYHGGKWRIAPWIIKHFPEHRVYVEPFAGAASVLLRKPRSFAEVINDPNAEICNVFRVLRDKEQSAELERVLRLTPFHRKEFDEAHQPWPEQIEQARRTIARCMMGYGGTGHNPKLRTGFRANGFRERVPPAMDWSTYPDQIELFNQRLRGVTIECRDAWEVIWLQDRDGCLFYIDPPYLLSTRSRTDKRYSHEYNHCQHVLLSIVLHQVEGMVVVSHYDCDLYDRLYAGWMKVSKTARTDGGKKRVECLYISPNAAERLQGQLFEDH